MADCIFSPQGAENNDFIRKEPPSLEFPNNTKSPSLETLKLLDSLLTQTLGLNLI
jgi:hypothetical protein